MPNTLPPDSVGLVTPQVMHCTEPLTLASGKILDEYQLVYETYGELNANRSNAVLVCHALSGSHHAAGYHRMEDRKPGWWTITSAPAKPLIPTIFLWCAPTTWAAATARLAPPASTRPLANPGAPTFPKYVCATGYIPRRGWRIIWASSSGRRWWAAAWVVCK